MEYIVPAFWNATVLFVAGIYAELVKNVSVETSDMGCEGPFTISIYPSKLLSLQLSTLYIGPQAVKLKASLTS